MEDALRNNCFTLYNNQNYLQVVKILKPLLESDSEDAELHHLYGVCLFKIDNVDLALYHLNKAVNINSKKEYISNLGNVYLKKSNYKKAVETFLKLLEFENKDYKTIGMLANAYYELKDYINAKKYYEISLELNHNFIEANDRLGDICFANEKYEEALGFYKKVLELSPLQENVHYNMGVCYKKLKNYDKAIESYLSTIKLSKKYYKAFNSLGNIFTDKNEFSKAYRCFKKCIEINPDFLEAYKNLGSLCVNFGKIKEGIEYYNIALSKKSFNKSVYYLHNEIDKIEGTLADIYLNLSMAQFLLGDFRSGWNNYEFRFYISEKFKPIKIRLNRPFLDGLDVINKNIFIYFDQGIGDTIFFSRYFRQLINMNNKIILFCQKELICLLKASFPEIDFIDDHKLIENYDVDYFIPVASLPYLFQRLFKIDILEADKYIHANHNKALYFKENFFNNDKLKIGVCWKGNPIYGKDNQRSMSLEHFLNLAEIPNTQFYSLQKENGDEEIEKYSKQMNIINLADQLRDFMDTASVIENLDLVISVDTSVAHISGAMLKKTLLMLPYCPDWRWQFIGDTSPWYKKHKLLRQVSFNDWSIPLNLLYNEVLSLSSNS